MQRTANLITALTALALVVAFVAGLSFQAQRANAAAASIAALNVGTCHSTDLTVLTKADCNPHYMNFEFNRQGQSDPEEVKSDDLYATYAHDPKTADEPPRAILQDADLIKLSIKDEGRDVRSGVLVRSQYTDPDGELELSTGRIADVVSTADVDESKVIGEIVASAIDGYTYDKDNAADTNVPAIEVDFEFERINPDSGVTAIEITDNGIVEILFNVNTGGDADDEDNFKPIAEAEDRGEMRFFGKIENGGDDYPDVPWGPLDDYLEWDEDVISGSDQQAPSISVQANLRVGDTLTLEVIHYLTSEVEHIEGGDRCLPLGFEAPPGDGDDADGNPIDPIPATTINEAGLEDKGAQAACTNAELGDDADDYELFKLDVSSDGDQSTRNLYLQETGRFTGVFQGYIRLTDANGDGGDLDTSTGERMANASRDDWGRVVKHATDQTVENAAVIGVDNGPVRISYKDTDGSTRSFTIKIDIGPPTIDVTGPEHNGRSDDEEINFSGTINDGESGLAVDSFALYLDHDPDDDEATGDPDSLALDIPVDGTSGSVGDVSFAGTGDDAVIETATQYTGYVDESQETFGIVGAGLVYPDPGENMPGVTDDDSETKIKGIDSDDFGDGDNNAAFRDSIRVNFLEDDATTPYNHAVDFQAVVRDRAGNVGFSDSDEVNPRYINDLGTKLADRDEPNVLGFYSRHIVYIDNVDPEIDAGRTVTGFFDVDSDKAPVVDRSGVMVVFDGPVDARGIDVNTFTLTMGEGANKESLDVIDTKVSGKLVFLKLSAELASDAEPSLTISDGEEVRDLAGRVTRADEQDPVTVNDGNLPKFTVVLTGGSGLGDGAEGGTRLTKDTIKIAISSDEEIQGAPRVAVVCSNLVYPGAASGDESRDVSDYVDALNGATSTPSDTRTGNIDNPACGSSSDDYSVRPASALSRRDNQWEYTWRQYELPARVPEGLATVVVWGNDRSQYTEHDGTGTVSNYGTVTSEFRFDSVFKSPLNDDSGGRVLPAADSDVAERRPFVLLDFAGEPTTVTVTQLMVDGVDVTGSLDQRGQNQFLYWPETLASGEHEVKFTAHDAANNMAEDETFKFEVTVRDPFVLSLFAGWNAISFPANPKTNNLEAVFGETSVERVVGWNPGSATGPWAVATKSDGVWTTSTDTAALTELHAQYGYWVYSTAFVDVSVELQGPIDRETGGVPGLTGVATYPGWNFVGVVDQDGDQTEGRAGSNLKDGIVNVAGEANVGQQDDIMVKDYLAGFARAYRWDVITNTYQVLKADDNIKIGEGIWAYFSEGIAP